jgi:hypothetical protein
MAISPGQESAPELPSLVYAAATLADKSENENKDVHVVGETETCKYFFVADATSSEK